MTPYKPLMDVQQVTRPLEIRETSPVRKKTRRSATNHEMF